MILHGHSAFPAAPVDLADVAPGKAINDLSQLFAKAGEESATPEELVGLLRPRGRVVDRGGLAPSFPPAVEARFRPAPKAEAELLKRLARYNYSRQRNRTYSGCTKKVKVSQRRRAWRHTSPRTRSHI